MFITDNVPWATLGATGGKKSHMQAQSEVAPHVHRSGVASSASGYPDANGFVVGGAGNDRAGGGRGTLIVSNTNNTFLPQTEMPIMNPYILVNYEVIAG